MVDPVAQVHEVYPYIYHYTSRDGLMGILNTQTLFATQYQYLNDLTEIESMRVVLIRRLQHYIKDLNRQRLTSEEERKFVTSQGGEHILAFKQAKGIIDALYKTTFRGGALEFPYAEPFITSFCQHTDDEDYERENGLLSQWRGYAGIRENGGFAIVFDTEKLAKLLQREHELYHLTVAMGNVIYDGDANGFDREFGDLVKKLETLSDRFFSGVQEMIEGLLEAFVYGVSRFKHRAFREEREVRIIVSPTKPELYAAMERSDPTFKRPNRVFKEEFKRPGTNVRTIRLFDYDKKEKLPILKIIVGPRRDQTENLKLAEALVEQAGMDVEIQASETPYTGE